jgi:hypothetical protein
MTEAEWLVATDPTNMLVATSQARTERKLRLLLTHSARCVWDHITPTVLREAIEIAECHTEGEVSAEALTTAKTRATLIGIASHSTPEDVRWWQDSVRQIDGAYHFLVLATTTHGGMMPRIERQHAWHGAVRAAREYMPGLFREIFGPLPFRPVIFSDSWRPDTAVTLANQMYDSRDFGAIPILADALQDAGCDDEDILNHCRDANATHVRGCWVVDLVLGKE